MMQSPQEQAYQLESLQQQYPLEEAQEHAYQAQVPQERQYVIGSPEENAAEMQSRPRGLYPIQAPQEQPSRVEAPQQQPGQRFSPTQQPVIIQNFYQAPPLQTPLLLNIVRSEPAFLARVLWFILVGWWFGLIWLHIGYALCLTGILLPIGLTMLNRLPFVLTLRSSRPRTTVSVSPQGLVIVNVGQPQQLSLLTRAIYFILVGFWLGYMWALFGYILCFTIVLTPIGVMMLNRLPTVLTLRRI